MLNSLDLPGRPEDTRIVVAMSGGVDSSVVAGILARQGYDVVGMTLQLYNHGEAVHRKGACCAGQDIHDARRVAETLGIPHYVLDYEEKFRKAVIDPFAQELPRRRNADPLRFLQPDGQVRRSSGNGKGSGRGGAGNGALYRVAAARSCNRTARPVPPGGPCPGPELFPVRHHPGAGRLSALSPRPSAEIGNAGNRPRARPRHCRQAGQPGHLLRSPGKIYGHHLQTPARCGGRRRDRPSRRAGARPPRGHHPLHHRPAPGHRHCRLGAALRGSSRPRQQAGDRRAARGPGNPFADPARCQLARRGHAW